VRRKTAGICFFCRQPCVILISTMRSHALCLFCLLLVGCGASNRETEETAAAAEAMPNDTIQRAAFLTFARASVVDAQTQMDAVACLVPEGWKTAAWSKWVRTDFIEPFKYALVVSDTDTVNRIEVYPTLSYFTSTERLTAMPDAPDKAELMYSPQLASTAVDAIRDFLIPSFRPGLRDLRLKEYVPLSSLDDVDPDGKPESKETGVVRIAYELGGEAVEEIFFATLSKHLVPVDKYDTQCRWHIENAVSCRAHEGYLDDQLKNLQTLVGSMRYGYSWLLKYDRALRQIRHLQRDTLSVSELTAALSEQPTDAGEAPDVFQLFQRRLARRASVYNGYQSLLQNYVDNTGEFVQLPKGFAMAWKSDDNRYILTDSDTYKPAAGPVAWYELKKNESRQESDVFYTKGMENEGLDAELNK